MLFRKEKKIMSNAQYTKWEAECIRPFRFLEINNVLLTVIDMDVTEGQVP